MKAASIYGRAGFRVVPLHDVTSGACSCGDPACRSAGKHPRLKSWETEATSDAETIAEWIARYPSGNIGIATGGEFFALDVDPAHDGPATLARLTDEHGDLPITPEAVTGSGGAHYLFEMPTGLDLRNTAGRLGRGLDTRGDGGQIVVAPSVSLKGAYSWAPGRAPWQIPIAPAPAWLVELLKAPAARPLPAGTSNTERGHFPAAGPQVLAAAAADLDAHGPAVDGDGGGLHTVHAAAILTHDWALTEAEAWPIFVAWNEECQPPWELEGANSLREKLHNGIRYGKAEFGRRRSLDALERAQKTISDWRAGPTPDTTMTAMVERVREIARQSGDTVRHAQILAELQRETGLSAKALDLPKVAAPPVEPPADAIVVTPRLALVADEAAKVILPGVFARNGVLCEIVPGDRPGRTFISDLETARIQDLMSRATKWVRNDGENGLIEQAAPEAVARILHARRMHPRVRVLEAVTTAPVFLADGSILSARGYNAEARLFLEPSCAVDVPDAPTLADARAAVWRFGDLLSEYTFATRADFSAWLAGLLSPLVKSATNNAATPLFLVTAPSRAAGKTMLAQIASIVVTGAEVGCGTYAPKDLAEWEKKLTAFVREADPIVLFDNVGLGVELGDEGLDRLLTGSTWKGRILGVSEAPPLPVVTTFWATGNNTAARSDTVRRVLPIRLDVTSEKPQERTFSRPKLKLFAEEYRSVYLSAALTILRAYHCAGRPLADLPTWGSFEVWSDLVRGALVWAGCADPFETQARAAAVLNEPENDAHDFWLEVVGTCSDGTAASVCATANMKDAQTRLAIRDSITPRGLRKFLGPYVDKPRLRRRIRYADQRYTIEGIA